jgi:hypothetical protein
MGRYHKPSPETEEEALRIARATQQPGQGKEETRRIAQGIQKGIDLYKRQQKAKTREQDRQRKRQARQREGGIAEAVETPAAPAARNPRLPWVLLGLSWLGFAVLALICALI